MPILRVKDNDGNVKEIKAIVGRQGDSAYEVAKSNGFVGTKEEWIASLKGEKGDKPELGVDYWTNDDKNAVNNYIDEQVGAYGEKVTETNEYVESIKNNIITMKDDATDDTKLAIGNGDNTYELPTVTEMNNAIEAAKEEINTSINNNKTSTDKSIDDINAKLLYASDDESVTSPEFDTATEIHKLNAEVNTVKEDLNEEALLRKTQDDVLNSRMDKFTSLPEGSTAGDAELMDIRVKANGETSGSAGSAVREQIDALSTEINTSVNQLKSDLAEISTVVNSELGLNKDLSFNVTASRKGSATAYYFDIASEELKAGRNLTFKLNGYTGAFFQLFKVFLLTPTGGNTQIIVNGVGSFQQDMELSYAIDSLKEYSSIRFYVQTTNTEEVNPQWNEKIVISTDGELRKKIEDLNGSIEDIDKRFDSPLKGLKIGFLGDSFTEGVMSYGVNYYYGSYIAEKTGCTHVNYGVAGSRYTDNNYRDSFWKRTETMDADLDIVCVMGGINDANKVELYTTKLGTIDDPVFTSEQIANKYNDGTFYQGCKTTIELLLAKYPNAKILMAIPPHVLNASYNPTINAYDGIETIIGAEIAIAKYYGIPVVNLWDNCTELNNYSANVSAYRQGMNNIHPNRNGHKAMAHHFTNALERLVKNDYLKD